MKSLLIFFLFLHFNLVAQVRNKVDFHFNTQRKNANITIDHFGNIYVFTNRVIDKYNSSGRLLYSYSVTNASSITTVDVVNPLRILVFFRDINQVTFLDNTLSETGISLNLTSIDLPLTSWVCNSISKGFWVFDSQNIELIHVSNTLETISKSGNLALVLQKELNITGMKEFNNELYLMGESSILVFDIFGTYHKEIPIICNPCVFTENAIYGCNQELQSYDFKSRQLRNMLTFDELDIHHKKISNGANLYMIDELGAVHVTSIKN